MENNREVRPAVPVPTLVLPHPVYPDTAVGTGASEVDVRGSSADTLGGGQRPALPLARHQPGAAVKLRVCQAVQGG